MWQCWSTNTSRQPWSIGGPQQVLGIRYRQQFRTVNSPIYPVDYHGSVRCYLQIEFQKNKYDLFDFSDSRIRLFTINALDIAGPLSCVRIVLWWYLCVVHERRFQYPFSCIFNNFLNIASSWKNNLISKRWIDPYARVYNAIFTQSRQNFHTVCFFNIEILRKKFEILYILSYINCILCSIWYLFSHEIISVSKLL